VENARIAEVLEEIAGLLDMQGGAGFRARAYRNAARLIRAYPRRIADLVAAGEDLTALPGIGKSTAAKIADLVTAV